MSTSLSNDEGTIDDIVVLPSPQDPPPDGGYGWVCVGACFCINGFVWGEVASYGVYLSYYLSNNIFPTATPRDFAFIGGFNFSMAMLVAPFVTITTRKFGPQVPMLFGVGFLAASHISASFSREIWQLYLSQGVLMGLGVGFTYIPSIAVLPQWFEKKRSLVNGISAAGSGIGGLIFSFLIDACIKNISLAWSFRITAIVDCSVLLVATSLIRTRNEIVRPPQLGFDTKLLRRYDVQLLLAWGFIVMFGYMVLLYSLPDYGRSLGISSTQAATVAAILNLGSAVGRPLIGVLSDRYGRIETSGIVTLICGLSCFVIWLPTNSYGVLILFAFIAGAILGVFWATIGPLCAEVAGLREVPSLLSLSWTFIILPTTFSEVIGLQLRRPDSSRPYLYPQIFAGLSYIAASACLWELRRIKHNPGSPK